MVALLFKLDVSGLMCFMDVVVSCKGCLLLSYAQMGFGFGLRACLL